MEKGPVLPIKESLQEDLDQIEPIEKPIALLDPDFDPGYKKLLKLASL